MPSAFTTFASSRFLDRETVLRELHRAARSLKEAHPEIVAVTLFGSFVVGVPTPRSDVDILVEVSGSLSRAERLEAAGQYAGAFQSVEVPVDVFVGTSGEIAASIRDGRGLAATARRTGLRLA